MKKRQMQWLLWSDEKILEEIFRTKSNENELKDIPDGRFENGEER